MKALASEYNKKSTLSKFVKTHYSPLICNTKISVRSSEQTLRGYCESVGFCQIALSTRHGDNTRWQATGEETEQVWLLFGRPFFPSPNLSEITYSTSPLFKIPLSWKCDSFNVPTTALTWLTLQE